MYIISLFFLPKVPVTHDVDDGVLVCDGVCVDVPVCVGVGVELAVFDGVGVFEGVGVPLGDGAGPVVAGTRGARAIPRNSERGVR